jgi:putative methyltransferase (TIGR04325 family)
MRSRRTWVGAVRKLGRIAARAGDGVGLVQLRKLAHRTEFAQGRPPNGYSGVFATVEEAARAIPPGQPSGYDHDEMAAYYRNRLDHPQSDDYAPMFWLRTAVAGAQRVFDLGGHVGVAYHAFRRFLELPDGLIWTVCDVPAVVRAGEEVARERGTPSLRFTTRQEDADGADVLYTAGALQYLPEGALHGLLGRLARPPPHVIVQLTPLHDSRSYVTIQATGHAFCPYTVASRKTFVAGMEQLGYRLVDAWDLPRSMEVPFEPWTRVEHYAGLYLRR